MKTFFMHDACNRDGMNIYVGCTPGLPRILPPAGSNAGHPALYVVVTLLLISFIVNVFQCVKAANKKNEKKQPQGGAKEADTCEGDPLATTGTNANVPAPGAPEEYVRVPVNCEDDREETELRPIGNGAASPLGTDSQQDDVAVATVHATDQT